jgi:hypothetical protein
LPRGRRRRGFEIPKIEDLPTPTQLLGFILKPSLKDRIAAAWAEQCGARVSDWQDVKKRSANASGFQIALRLTLADMNVGIEWDKI